MTKIIWSSQAKQDYWQNIDYLLEKWSDKEAANFTYLVSQSLFIIQKNPKLFQTTDYLDIRRAVITPHITLFYRMMNKEVVELIRFWNNYQDPEKLDLS